MILRVVLASCIASDLQWFWPVLPLWANASGLRAAAAFLSRQAFLATQGSCDGAFLLRLSRANASTGILCVFVCACVSSERLQDIMESMFWAWNKISPGLISWLSCSLVLWPWASFLTSLSFFFFWSVKWEKWNFASRVNVRTGMNILEKTSRCSINTRRWGSPLLLLLLLLPSYYCYYYH